MNAPAVTFSLDFELRWGVYDLYGLDLSAYRANLVGEREVVPKVLSLFTSRGVRATWATVGALACASWDEFFRRAPIGPSYSAQSMRRQEGIVQADPEGELYFAPELVELVAKTPGQDLGSHTFEHLYAREPGVTAADVERDCDAVKAIFQEKLGVSPVSFVYPRNQVTHWEVFKSRGLKIHRDNQHAWYWQSTAAAEQSKRARALRLVDALAPLGDRRSTTASEVTFASHFVRFNLPELAWRIHVERMLIDARRLQAGQTMHLWFHPHNLGAEQARSLSRLEMLLDRLGKVLPKNARFLSMRDLTESSPREARAHAQ